jgi:hypothetical protein
VTGIKIDDETQEFYEQVPRLLNENNAILKSNYRILEALSENVTKIKFNTKLVKSLKNYLGLWRLRLSALAYFLLPDLWAL